MCASGCGSMCVCVKYMYMCKWVWHCVFGQLGECMCASGCGSVCG